ncbi:MULTISPECIES: AMP-binding protein [Nostocales]|jgi:acyl-CoA synthetase (AMP-forming)/AMP-acid ligase II|uniref:Fatty acyl-AMP ligase n=1 Tax=Dolichospermum flos-aquae UHCC 0037 TaxID=2590026 RepID=A0ACC7S6R1_DOLFA|nr:MULTISPECIES: AMP-binding protein [Nostocales]MBO1067695.1 fatty acyl-AMP ligase [Anabaena sp. 54]MBO1072308.1 fatty acyl-AMP ligase [Dolichospermum sp. DEX189]MTJ43187.1 fatty acyl-AMP ligase [Dolichospermum flos-aquae UHCC 0037]
MIEFKALNTLDQLLTYRAKVQPNRRAYTMLDINGAEDSYITYGDMYSQVINIAQRLLSEGLQSRNAILLYPPGIEFIVAFFGCLYAGVLTCTYPYPKTQSFQQEDFRYCFCHRSLSNTTSWQG